MKLNRQAIQRMIDAGQLNVGGRKSGGGSGAGGGGGVSATWVDDNYISKAFFARLFTVHSNVVTQDDPHGEVIEPNDAETTIDNLETLIDFWSDGNVSALGPAASGGGGGGLTLYEPLASINNQRLGNPTTAGQVIMWNGTQWTYGIPSGGGGVTMATVWQNLAAATTEQINASHLTSALTGYVKTADLSTLTIGKADKLATARNLWGRSFDGSDNVVGTLEHVTNIQLQELSANTGAQIKFFYGGANSVTSSIYESQSGILSINGQIFATNNGNVGIGGSASGSYKLNVSGDAKASNLESAGYVKAASYLSAGSYITATTYISATTTMTAGTSITAGTTLNAGTNIIAGSADGTYIQIGNIRIGYDQTNDALEVYKLSGSSHASANLYARGNVSALGPAASGGGGGVSLNQPLSGINSSGLSAPTTNGQILMYDSSTGKWKYGTVGLTMDTVWNQLSNPTNQQINISHLTNALSGYSTSDTRNTTGIYQSSAKLFLIGCEAVGTTADAYAVTRTNANCYIGTDNCLYSNGSVVLTSANAVMLTGDQSISGTKTFNNNLTKMVGTYGGLCIYAGIANGEGFRLEPCNSSGTWQSSAITVWQTGNVGIGTTTVSNYKFNVNGDINASSNIYVNGDAVLTRSNLHNVYSTQGTAGTSGYVKICEIVITVVYRNSPISFEITRRADKCPTRLSVTFLNGNTIDPGLSSFTAEGSMNDAYICKLATSTWGIYVHKSESYDLIDVVDYIKPSFMSGVSVTWTDTLVSSVPSGAVQASFLPVGNMVTTDTAQTISGAKTFSSDITVASGVRIGQGTAGSNMYLGRSDGTGWVMTQDIGSASSTSNWAIRTSGDARFKYVGINGYNTSYGLYCNSSSYITGNVGVGVAPDTTYALRVNGNAAVNSLTLGQNGGTGTHSISTLDTDASIQINGNSIGIGGTNNNYKFYVNGTSCLSSDVLINATTLPTGVSAKLYVKGDTCFDSGNVGIGTAPNSGYRLKVSGKTYMTALEVQGTSTASQNFTLTWNSDGYYELGTISGTSTEIRTAGQWYGVWRGASDIRKKNIVKNISVGVEQIAKTPIFDFTWKKGDDNGVYLGTSAQYIQQIFPSAVSKMSDGYWGLDYSSTALAAAVMTARKVVDHERRILELEAEIKRLREEMAS